jgi:hypothetical protein
MEIAIITVIVVIVAAYYGIFNLLERGSSMVERELGEVERSQKLRIVKRHSNAELHEDQWKAATANIAKLDALDI